MRDRSAEYAVNGGWSSKFFAANAGALLQELNTLGVRVIVGRTVIHIGQNLKAYVHHNGRSNEYATITDARGVELDTFHHTQFAMLRELVLGAAQ